jgi:hypothetical protein
MHHTFDQQREYSDRGMPDPRKLTDAAENIADQVVATTNPAGDAGGSSAKTTKPEKPSKRAK